MADPIDLEQMADQLSASGDYRVLRRVPIVERYADNEPDTDKRLGLIVDVETTGPVPTSDKIIDDVNFFTRRPNWRTP